MKPAVRYEVPSMDTVEGFRGNATVAAAGSVLTGVRPAPRVTTTSRPVASFTSAA